jgi:hypothetical protein
VNSKWLNLQINVTERYAEHGRRGTNLCHTYGKVNHTADCDTALTQSESTAFYGT